MLATFAGRLRKGCSACGKFVVGLDHARSEVRMTSRRYANLPTQRNADTWERAAVKFQEAKRLHDEHMASHDEGEAADQ